MAWSPKIASSTFCAATVVPAPTAISAPVGMNAVDVKTAIITARPAPLTAYAAPRATNRLSPASLADQLEHPLLPVADQPVGPLRQVGGRSLTGPARAARRPAGMRVPRRVRLLGRVRADPAQQRDQLGLERRLQIAPGRRTAGEGRDDPVAQVTDLGLQRPAGTRRCRRTPAIGPAPRRAAAGRRAAPRGRSAWRSGRPTATRSSSALAARDCSSAASARPSTVGPSAASAPFSVCRTTAARASTSDASWANQSCSGRMVSSSSMPLTVQRRLRQHEQRRRRHVAGGQHLPAGARRPHRRRPAAHGPGPARSPCRAAGPWSAVPTVRRRRTGPRSSRTATNRPRRATGRPAPGSGRPPSRCPERPRRPVRRRSAAAGTSCSVFGSVLGSAVRVRPGSSSPERNQAASPALLTSTGERVVGRSTPVG